MRLWMVLLLVLFCVVIADAKIETFDVQGYNVTFDLGALPHNVTLPGYGQEQLRNGISIDIDDVRVVNVTKFDGDDQCIPEITDVHIIVELFNCSAGIPTGVSGSIRNWELDTRFPHTHLDDLTRWNVRSTHYWEHINPRSVYRTIQIDGADGRLLTGDPLSNPVATFIKQNKFIIVYAKFGGYGTHLSLDAASTEEIEFKLSYLENFLKTLHIEKRGDA